MPLFYYKAKSSPHELVEGSIEADNEPTVISRIKSMGLYPVSISQREERHTRVPGLKKTDRSESSFTRSLKFFPKRKARIRQIDVTVFTRQLSDLIKAGIPLLNGLSVLAAQAEKPSFKNIIETIKENVQKGASFSVALAHHKDAFSPFYVNMVRAGEFGGILEGVLIRLAEYKEKQEDLKSQVRSSMAYPILLLVVGFITIFVLTSSLK